MKPRLYHIIAINDRTKAIVQMTGYPIPHDQCMTMLGKLTRYNWRTLQLVEVI